VETLEKAYPVKVFRDEDSSPAAGAGAAGGTGVPDAPPRIVGEADLRSLFLVQKDIEVVGRQGAVQDQQVRIAASGGRA